MSNLISLFKALIYYYYLDSLFEFYKKIWKIKLKKNLNTSDFFEITNIVQNKNLEKEKEKKKQLDPF